MSEVQKNKAVARKLLEADVRDVAAQLEVFHDQGRIVTMGSNLFSGVYDKSKMPALFGDVKGMFPDGLKMTIHNMIGERDFVAVEAESYGKHASGRIYNNHYHLLFRFKDGLILEMKEYFDTEHSSEVLCGGRRPSTDGG